MKLEILDITAYSANEAKEKAKTLGITSCSDATRSYENAIIAPDFDIKAFAEERLRTGVRDAVGLGYIITLNKGASDDRIRKYDPKVGKANYDWPNYYQVYEVVEDLGGGSFKVHSTFYHKPKAVKAAKALVNELNKTIKVRKTKIVDTTDPTILAYDAIVKFVPNPNKQLGKYLIFAYVED